MKKIILDSLLYETIKTGKKIAYHSSLFEFNAGDILDGESINRDFYKDKHYEQLIENIRKKEYPNKPSRLTSVYSSPFKQNAFNLKGITYIVELLGNFHYADSDLISDIAENSNQIIQGTYWEMNKSEQIEAISKNYILDKIHQYWNGKLFNKKFIEILSDKAKVLGVYEPKSYLYPGGKYEVIKPIFVILGSKREVLDEESELQQYFGKLEYDNRFLYGFLKPKSTIKILIVEDNNHNPYKVRFKVDGLKSLSMTMKPNTDKNSHLDVFPTNFFENHLRKIK